LKTRHILVLLLIALAIAICLLKPWAGSKPASAPEARISTAEPRPPPAPQPGAAPASGTDDALAHAGEMAAFINQVIDSLPTNNRAGIVEHLRGIQSIFFASDYIMAAKTNSRLTLSESAILAAFAKVSPDTSMMADKLRAWAVRPWTLTDHYRNISEVPQAKESIKAIKAAMTDNGVPVDTKSELLMDCIRYSVHTTDIQEMYGPNPKEGEPTPYPAALNTLSETGDAVFQHRFVNYYGLDPRAVTNLMTRIKDVRIYGLSSSDVQIPVVHFQ
jgi:hypothetical protein